MPILMTRPCAAAPRTIHGAASAPAPPIARLLSTRRRCTSVASLRVVLFGPFFIVASLGGRYCSRSLR
jgi:hypothetical protein